MKGLRTCEGFRLPVGMADLLDLPGPVREVAEVNVNATAVRNLLNEMVHRGADPAPLFEGLDMGASDLSGPKDFIGYSKASLIVRRVLAVIQDASLGLDIGRQQNVTTWGLLGLGAMACPTLVEAVQLYMRFMFNSGSMLHLRLQTSDQEPSLVAYPRFGDVAIAPFLVDYMFAGLVQIGRQLAGPDIHLKAVELVAQPWAEISKYQEIFRCPVRFACDRNRLVFGADVVHAPIRTANVATLNAVLAALDQGTTESQGPTQLATDLEWSILDCLCKPPTLAELAATRQISERTFRRQLSLAGISYSRLVKVVRQTRALELLLLARQPIDVVAAKVGYADARALAVVVRRWSESPLATM